MDPMMPVNPPQEQEQQPEPPMDDLGIGMETDRLPDGDEPELMIQIDKNVKCNDLRSRNRSNKRLERFILQRFGNCNYRWQAYPIVDPEVRRQVETFQWKTMTDYFNLSIQMDHPEADSDQILKVKIFVQIPDLLSDIEVTMALVRLHLIVYRHFRQQMFAAPHYEKVLTTSIINISISQVECVLHDDDDDSVENCFRVFNLLELESGRELSSRQMEHKPTKRHRGDGSDSEPRPSHGRDQSGRCPANSSSSLNSISANSLGGHSSSKNPKHFLCENGFQVQILLRIL